MSARVRKRDKKVMEKDKRKKLAQVVAVIKNVPNHLGKKYKLIWRIFRGILERIDPAEVYGCLKLLHNMHTSFGEIIRNRGVISSFSGMIDIALINNLNLLSYLKVNVKKRINDNRIDNTNIHNLLWDASGNGLIGYYSENENSAPVLCQIINPIIQQGNKQNIQNGVNMLLQILLLVKIKNFEISIILETTNSTICC